MADEPLAFLERREAPCCFRCLAEAFPRRQVKRQVEGAQRRGKPIVVGLGRCALCRQTTTVVAWLTGDRALARQLGSEPKPASRSRTPARRKDADQPRAQPKHHMPVPTVKRGRVVQLPATVLADACYFCSQPVKADDKVRRFHELTVHEECWRRDAGR